eukprot:7671329-Lingulodinium_polyedra.AAC.1
MSVDPWSTLSRDNQFLDHRLISPLVVEHMIDPNRRPEWIFEGKSLAEQQAMLGAAWRAIPDYARARAIEFYGQ